MPPWMVAWSDFIKILGLRTSNTPKGSVAVLQIRCLMRLLKSKGVILSIMSKVCSLFGRSLVESSWSGIPIR